MHLRIQKRSLAFLLALVLLFTTFASTAVVSVSAAEVDEAEVAVDVEAADTGANTYAAISGYPDPAIPDLTIETAAQSGSVYPFAVTTEDGYTALKSTNNGKASSFSYLKVTAAAAGLLSFYYKTSTEGSWDILAYKKGSEPTSRTDCLNTDSKSSFSGNQPWTQCDIVVDANDVVYIAYTKDSSGNTGSDTIWLRDFSLDTSAAPTSIEIVSNTEHGWIGTTKSTVASAAVSSFTGLSGMSQTFYAVPDAINGWDFEGLYTDPSYSAESKVACNKGDSYYGFNPEGGYMTVDHYREFSVQFPQSGTATYYAKFVQKPASETYTFTINFDTTYYSNVYFYVIGELYDQYYDTGWGNIDTRYEIHVNNGDTVTLYKGFQTHIKYTFTDPTGGDVADLDAQYTVDGTSYQFEQACILGVREDNDVDLPLTSTLTLTNADNSYRPLTVSNAIYADTDSKNNLPIEVRGSLPWSETTLSDGKALASGNKGVNSSLSLMKITPAENGLLSFDWKTSSEEGYDFLGYSTSGLEPAYEDYTFVNFDNSGYDAKRAWSGVKDDWATAEFVVQKNKPFYFAFYKDSGGVGGEDTAWVKNFRLLTGTRAISISANDAAYGNVSGSLANLAESEIGADCTLTATPKSGYQFVCWKEQVNGEWETVADTAEYTFIVNADRTFKAFFAPAMADGATAIASVYGAEFANLEDAFASAVDGDTVLLLTNYTQTADITIPAGVTLQIPFNAANTPCLDYPNKASNGTAESSRVTTEYRRLTLGENVDITVNGAIDLCATHYPGTGSYTGSVGTHARIEMADTSTIKVNDGGSLYAWGFITGGGMVTAESGAAIYELMQICDFRGGNDTLNMVGETNQFPFNQYYIQNIEAPLTVKAGAVENVFYDVYMSMEVSGLAEFIGDDGMFVLDDGAYLVRHYDAANDTMIYDLYGGNASIGSMTVTVSIMEVETSDYYLPINAMQFQLHEGTSLSTAQDIIFLPGSSVTVDEGASVVVEDGGSVVFADKEGIGNYTGAYSKKKPCIAAVFSPTRPASAKRTWAATTDASVDNNGSIIVEDGGAFGSTSGGANIYSSQGTGSFTIEGENQPANIDKWAGNSASDCDVVEITIETPTLSDGTAGAGEEHGTDVEDRWFPDSPTTFRQINGVWGDYRYLEFYDQDASPEDDPAAEPLYPRSATMISRDKLDDYVEANNIAAPEVEGSEGIRYAFHFWDPIEDYCYEDNGKSIVWLSANYTEYDTITWLQDDGTLIDTTEVEYGETPTHADPTKDADGVNTYTFAGWDPAVVRADGPATYQATYKYNKHSLTLNGSIGVNFYMLLPDGYTADQLTMDFSWGNKFISTNTYDPDESYTLNDVTGTQDGSYVKFTVPLAPKELNDEITATLKAGDTVLSTETYRGTDYAYKVLETSDIELVEHVRPGKTPVQLKQLVKDMLIYCAKAQINFEYNTDDLADYGLGNYVLAPVNTSSLGTNNFENLPSDLQFYTTILNLGSETSYSVALINWSKRTLETSAKFNGTDEEVATSFTRKSQASVVKIENIPAARVTDNIDLTIDGQTVTVNIGDFIRSTLENKSSDDPAAIAVTALYAYNQSAKTYFS